MCEKVKILHDTFKSIQNKKNIISKDQYLSEMKQFRKDWIEVAMGMDSCSEELKKIGNEMVFEISLN